MGPSAEGAGRFELYRDGRWHGFAELQLHAPLPPARLATHWHAGRPVLLRGAAAAWLKHGELLGVDLHPDELAASGGLRALVQSRRAAFDGRYECTGTLALEDPLELERLAFLWRAEPARGAERMRDLWVATRRLTGAEDDGSVGLTVGFGRGGVERDRPDHPRARRAAELAAALLPELGLIEAQDELRVGLERLAGRELFARHPSAWWWPAESGARFLDPRFGFDPLALDLASAWVQLSGQSLWIALPREELTRELALFGAELREPEHAWLAEQLFPGEGARDQANALLADPVRIASELERPFGGALAPLLERGPELTTRLLEHGHGAWLRAGDLLALPRTTRATTCLATSFVLGESLSYGIWLDLRAADIPHEANHLWELERAPGAHSDGRGDGAHDGRYPLRP